MNQSTMNNGWTKAPAYAPISLVPLKVGLVDQFRRAAAASSEAETLAQTDRLLAEKEALAREIKRISMANEEHIISQAKTRQNTVD